MQPHNLTPEEKTGGLIPYRAKVVHKSRKLLAVGTVPAASAVLATETLLGWFPLDRYEVEVTIKPHAFDLRAEADRHLAGVVGTWYFVVAARSGELSLVGHIVAKTRDDARTQLQRWFPEGTYEVSVV